MSGQRLPPTDGLLPRRVYRACPIMGTWERLGSRWARLPHAGFAGECALGVFSLCKSCFQVIQVRDIDLCGPMACFPGAYILRALPWTHVRVWDPLGAAATRRFTGKWPGPGTRRARNPRWEPGMGMIPDPRQIGPGGWRRGWTPDPRQIGDGDGGASGPGPDPRQIGPAGDRGWGWTPDCRRVPSSCT